MLAALTALKKGNFSICRLPVDWPGLAGKIADTFNEVTDRKTSGWPMNSGRVSRVVEAVVWKG